MANVMSTVFNEERFPWLKGAQCLVTGGAGFIGSHITEKLLGLGAKVTVLDDLSSGSENNLKGLNVEFVKGTITNSELVAKLVTGKDYVFHLAAIPAVPRSIEKPLETAWVNIWGTQLVLEHSRLNNIKRVILSSSSSAYGSIAGEFARTEDLAPQPISPYAAQKLSTEYLARAYALTLGLDTICLRYFNIFGPKQDPNSFYAAVIPKFIRAALEDRMITIYGDGTQKRDFTFVDNAVYANLMASSPKIKTEGRTVNIGCGTTFSLNALVEEVKNLVGKPLKVEKVATRAGDVHFSLADISKAQEVIGYKPVVTFEEGIRNVFDSLKGQ